ncbi:hypothetical protein G4F23_004600 [Salmonella enterica]|nr:hypothetical protein [Salmonella enterica]EEH8327252.1 hypothetical protein [Salmonella enterica]EEJ3642055.1 hypothetical protein [Salmonella enterica subsp. enterica]
MVSRSQAPSDGGRDTRNPHTGAWEFPLTCWGMFVVSAVHRISRMGREDTRIFGESWTQSPKT